MGLHITPNDINRIDKENRGNVMDCFREVFRVWQKQCKRPFTWSTMVEVLESPLVEENNIASNIRTKYML